jgi:hypothetical protein
VSHQNLPVQYIKNKNDKNVYYVYIIFRFKRLSESHRNEKFKKKHWYDQEWAEKRIGRSLLLLHDPELFYGFKYNEKKHVRIFMPNMLLLHFIMAFRILKRNFVSMQKNTLNIRIRRKIKSVFTPPPFLTPSLHQRIVYLNTPQCNAWFDLGKCMRLHIIFKMFWVISNEKIKII